MKSELPNSAYTIQPDFIRACKLANTEPTKRQASRFRMGKGRAYNVNRIISKAPPVPSWFDPKMDEPCPPLLNPNVEHDQGTIAIRDMEISEWRTRHAIQAREQWPKVWALKSLGLTPH